MTWSDEFNGTSGSAPDPNKWAVQSGGNGWGNGELQHYTSRPANLRLEDGNLVITAIQEKYAGPDGVQNEYTSARIKTEGRFSQQHGRFEARIKVATGKGLWSAFWLLGDDFQTKDWPGCGEVDIMENIGSEPTKIHGTMHGPGYSSDHSLTASYTLPEGRFSDGFHVFSVEWEPQVVRFFVDGNLYSTRTPADLPRDGRWVFEHPFFIVLNLAVGGNMPGNPGDSTVFPQKMLVDYVRVYSWK